MDDLFSVAGLQLEYLKLSGYCTPLMYASVKKHCRALTVLKLCDVEPAQDAASTDFILSYSS